MRRPPSAQTTVDDLFGRWETGLVEQFSPDGSVSAFICQTIAFTREREAYAVEAFGDPNGNAVLFTYVLEGP